MILHDVFTFHRDSLKYTCLLDFLPQEHDYARPRYYVVYNTHVSTCMISPTRVVTTIPAVLTPATGGFDPAHVCTL